MTIIKPNNHKKEFKFKLVLGLIGGILMTLIIYGGILYAKKVSLEHDILSYTESIQYNEVLNAELKNELFKIMDPQALEIIAAEKGLIKDLNPQWVFVSTL